MKSFFNFSSFVFVLFNTIRFLQLVFLSVGGAKTSRAGTNSWGDAPSQLPPPPRSMLPTLLLLKPQYFDKLFNLMQTLGEMTIPGNKGVNTSTRL